MIVVSIPDYGYTPSGSSNQAAISKQIDQYNATAKHACDSNKITYIDITPISRKGLQQPELVASDGLHPSALMYSQWVDLMFESAYIKVK